MSVCVALCFIHILLTLHNNAAMTPCHRTSRIQKMRESCLDQVIPESKPGLPVTLPLGLPLEWSMICIIVFCNWQHIMQGHLLYKAIHPEIVGREFNAFQFSLNSGKILQSSPTCFCSLSLLTQT